MFCMEKKRPEHWYMHIMPVSFSIYNGVTQRARHISITYREQGHIMIETYSHKYYVLIESTLR